MEKSSSSRNSATVCGHVIRKQHVEVKGRENLQEKKTWNDSAFLADLDVFTVCAESAFSGGSKEQRNFFAFPFPCEI